MLLKTVNLYKQFINKKVLQGFDIEIEKGYIYGLAGPNGSGKSTFMKIICGLMQKTSGEIEFEDKKFNVKSRYNIAYQPTESYFYKWMKVKDVIKFYEDFYNDFNSKKAKELVENMKLDMEQKVISLSTGQEGRLKVLLVLSRNVSLYMLDEPLNGIDPVSRDKIMELIANEIDGEKTIIVSSHLIKEFETIIDRIIFLKDGKALINSECDELRMEKNMSIHDYYKEIFS